MAIKTPTIDSFIETLGKMGKGKFATDSYGNIRYSTATSSRAMCTGDVCPIEYLAARGNHKAVDEYYGSVWLAASLLGLEPMDRRMIVCAADKSPGYDKNLRKRMLAAVGL